MSAAKEVTATLALEQHLLTASKSGTGSGTVTSSPAGISCGASCAASFDHGTEVTLTPAAGAGSEFKGWGGACSGTGTCKVTLSAAEAVTAAFDLTTSTPTEPEAPNPTPPSGTDSAPFSETPVRRGGLIGSPVTLAGPSSEVVDFGGAAMAPDGSGGVVYLKAIEGVPHVFANRCAGGGWSAPIRVDADQPYGASQPRIAAGRNGELLVVWVGQVATVKGKIRYGLFSASIGRGASSFGPSLLVDANVGEGTDVGVDPSLSGTASGQAIVAYRVITYRFDGTKLAAQLRPGDVLADVRVARFKDDRWSGLGAINVNQELSTRAPSATNGPKVGAGIDGGAVVAWQEPDQTGTARIYVRRIFGTALGPILQASPGSWAGVPVTGDADAFSLSVTPLDQARIAMRIAGNGGEAPARLFLNTLPAGFKVPANALVGAKQVFAPESPTAAIGLPGIAAYEKGGQEGQLRLAYVAGTRIQQVGVDNSGTLAPITTPAEPAAVAGAEAVSALNPEGGGVVAYPALDANGRVALAVRQEFANGAGQVGLLSGRQQGGPIAELRLGSSGAGDALIGFRQGEPGRFQIVAERVSARPTAFRVKGPKGWTRPKAVKLKWKGAGSASGDVTYTVLIGGRAAKRGLRRHVFHPRPDQLGDGKRAARVMAIDAFGQQVLSKPVKLLVDGEPPLIRLRGPSGRQLSVRVQDPDSGPQARATWVEFGDGARATDGTEFRHVYERAGRYRVVVHAADRAGNRSTRSFEVRVP